MYRQIFQKNKNSKDKQTNFLKNRKFQKMCRQIENKQKNMKIIKNVLTSLSKN